ncbi:zinc-dependent metalloprotease [Natronogracilivirga saccharolytica]|uniref:Zinc-dependent metalloprotease n=1 Tax=Natronogracilivirga saccharolytica TaxID=2812953 RepID=A0A8J7RTK8_9BACT|nr:zinc-dependent metalloprotease [Natronogracilivirga saccharolytica]MBP3193649.1 zinc-dependent metalloprotease [Natronogracilivirga saccharolytica]
MSRFSGTCPSRPTSRLFTLLVLCTLPFALPATAASSGGNELFRFTQQKQLQQQMEMGDAAIISLNDDLTSRTFKKGDVISVPVQQGTEESFEITAVSEFIGGIQSVRAVHVDDPYSQMTFSFGNGQMLGKVDRFSSGESYRILPASQSMQKSAPGSYGEHIWKFRNPDQEQILECGVDDNFSGLSDPAHSHHHDDPMSQSRLFPAFDIASDVGENNVPIDILLVYTEDAETWAAENEGSIELVLSEMMNLSQQTMDNSGANIELRVAHQMKTTYEEEGNDTSEDLYRLTASSGFNPWGSDYDGYMDAVHSARDQYGADLVSLIADISDVGGIAFLMSNPAGTPQLGFSVNAVRQMTNTYTFAHEIGHNLGNQHSRNQERAAANIFGGLFSYATGWRFTGDDGRRYTTVMTYAEGDERIPYFSSPDVRYQGTQTGSYSGSNAPADNVRNMLYTRNIAANYRPTQVDPPEADVDDGLIVIDGDFQYVREISVPVSNNGTGTLYWTADVSYPEALQPPVKIAGSGGGTRPVAAGEPVKGPGRPVISSSYPALTTEGKQLIRHTDRPEYQSKSVPFVSSGDDRLSGGTASGKTLPGVADNGSGRVSNTILSTNFGFTRLLGNETQRTVSNEWASFPRETSNEFTITHDNPTTGDMNLRLTPVTSLDEGSLTGVEAPFTGSLVSQGFTISMDLHLPELESDNQFHVIMDDATNNMVTTWLRFDEGKIWIRDRITEEGNDFFDVGATYEPDEYFNLEIEIDPLNRQITYLIDGLPIFEGDLYGGSTPEAILLAHTNYHTDEVFDIDNFHVVSLPYEDFPRFQIRKPSGGIAAGDQRDITFEVMADGVADGTYEFDLVIRTNDRDNSEIIVPVEYEVSGAPVSADPGEMVAEFNLGQNYPNPFNPSTTISYTLPERSDVRLDVINVQGRRVATLVNDNQAPGEYEVQFDATGLASGVYLYRLQAGSFTRTERMVLVK